MTMKNTGLRVGGEKSMMAESLVGAGGCRTVDIRLQRKDTSALLPTDILFQSAFWSNVKSRLGWTAHAFDLAASGCVGDVLVLTRPYADGAMAAYVPQGPEYGPHPEQYGPFLENLSQAMARYLEPKVAFIRYDLPWESQYSIGGDGTSGLSWAGRPEVRLREMRMNYGTQTWNLRKAPIDLTVADALVVDISGTEDELLSRMKSKTRYNIRLSERKGVRIFAASKEMLPVFYDLYRETAERNGFAVCEYRYFSALFSVDADAADASEVHFLLAAADGDVLAGAIVAVSAQTATYLFGASSCRHRNMMGASAVQWGAIRLARARGCVTYDMGAVPPADDPGHPFYGMYRFKAGFGGKVVHRSGSWDFPLDDTGYAKYRNAELLGMTLP